MAASWIRPPPIPREDSLPCDLYFSDLDGDWDVDQADFAIFQRCFGGENVPAEPNCAD